MLIAGGRAVPAKRHALQRTRETNASRPYLHHGGTLTRPVRQPDFKLWKPEAAPRLQLPVFPDILLLAAISLCKRACISSMTMRPSWWRWNVV